METKFYKEYKITSKKFWENFWEYYKIHLLILAMIVFLVVIGVKSCVGKVETDIKVTYLGKDAALSPTKLEMHLEKWADDMDGDGEVKVEILNNSTGGKENVETTVMMLNMLDADFMSADPFIFITDDEFIGRFLALSAFQPIGDIAVELGIPEEETKRDNLTHEIVAIDITERPISKEIGIPPESKMYIGVKVMQKNKADDEDYINKHNQAVKMLKQMIEFE